MDTLIEYLLKQKKIDLTQIAAVGGSAGEI